MVELHRPDIITHENTARQKNVVEEQGTPKVRENHTHMFIDCDVGAKQSSYTILMLINRNMFVIH